MKRRSFLKNTSLASAGIVIPDWISRTVKNDKPRILVYGFNAFEDEVNVSQKIIQHLRQEEFNHINLSLHVFGTRDEALYPALDKAITNHKPDIIIGLGEVNAQDEILTDVVIGTRAQLKNPKLLESDNKINLKTLEAAFKNEKFTAIASKHKDVIGSFACGKSFYHSLKYFDKANKPKGHA